MKRVQGGEAGTRSDIQGFSDQSFSDRSPMANRFEEALVKSTLLLPPMERSFGK